MKIGIIGTGVIAISNHIPAYRELGHIIEALADVVPGRAKKFAKQFQIPLYYEDYKELLACDYIDAVSICVPTFLHEQIAVDALESGKHVYLEKPPAFDEMGIRHIYEVAQKSEKTLLVGSNSLYHPQYQIAKQLIDHGRLGNIYVAKVNRMQTREVPLGWFAKKQYTRGFVIMEGLTHNLDELLWLLNEPKPISVSCMTYNMFPNYEPLVVRFPMDAVESGKSTVSEPKETEDGCVGMIVFEGGLAILIETFKACNAPKAYNLRLYGDKAGLLIDHNKMYWEKKDGGLTLFEEIERGVFSNSELDFKNHKWSHTAAIAHFMECIVQGKQTLSNGKRAMLIMKIIDAMFASAEQNGRQILL